MDNITRILVGVVLLIGVINVVWPFLLGPNDRELKFKERVLMMSFDGFRWNYLERTHTPNFDRIVQNGVHARRGLKNCFITKTYPNHYSIATGLYVESHGVTGNSMYDPKLGRLFTLANISAKEDPVWFDNGGEPIWVTNQLQNQDARSGVLVWQGGGAAVKGVSPTHWVRYDPHMSNETMVDTMNDWLTDPTEPVNLGLWYNVEPDRFAHRYGPDSEQVTGMIGGLDGVLGYMLRRLEETGILETTNIIITSDHGFSSTPPSKTINLDTYVDPKSYTVLTDSPVACIWPHKGKFTQVYKGLRDGAQRNENFDVWLRWELPERFHFKNNDRISPIIALAKNEYSFSMRGVPYIRLGDHGYDNELQDMHPFFVAMGPAFKKNFSVDTFDTVDIYPLLCRILGLEPAPNNGSMEVVQHLLLDQEEIGDGEVLEESFTQSQYAGQAGERGDGDFSSSSSVMYIGMITVLILSVVVLVGSLWQRHGCKRTNLEKRSLVE